MPVFNNALAGAAGSGGAADFKIDRSLRFDSGSSSYLSKTPSSAGNRKTWTWSGWVKRSSNTQTALFHAGSSNQTLLWFDGNHLEWTYYAGGYGARLRSTALFRDFSAWMHVVFVLDTTTSTANNRMRMYINGSELTDFDARTNPSPDALFNVNNTVSHEIGRNNVAGGYNFNGYLADIHFIDGQALAPTDFGGPDDNGVWQPKAYSGTYGTNGFHLDFSDTSNLGNDAAGSNNWTPTNFFYLNSKTEVASAFTRTGTTHGPESNILDNNTATACGVQAGTLTYTPSGTTTVSDKIKFWYTTGQSNTQFRVNSGNWTTLPQPSGVGTYTYTAFTGTVTSMEWRAPTSSELVSVHQIQIDDQILVNPTIAAGNDSLIDTPTNYEADSGNNGGNYATWNPLDVKTTIALSNGNLDLVGSSDGRTRATMAMPSGNWYWEITIGAVPASNHIGIWATNVALSNDTYRVIYRGDGYWIVGGSAASGWSSVATGDIVGITFDASTRETKFYKNNSLLGTKTAPALPDGSAYTPAVILAGSNSSLQANFGQRPFAYTPPTGFKSLCTQNLPPPTIEDPSTAFDAKLWNGDGNSTKSISNYSFSPDFVWIKNLTTSGWQHVLYDQVRGEGTSSVTKSLSSDSNRSEASGNDTNHGYLSGFTSNGFDLTKGSQSSGDYVNHNNWAYVGWAWDAGSAANPTSISVGGLNSSMYNQSQTWSTYGTFTGTVAGQYDWSGVFSASNDWDAAGSMYLSSGTGKWTLTSSIACSSGVKFYVHGNHSITINEGLSDEITQTSTGGNGFHYFTIPFSGNISSIKVNTSQVYLIRIYVDGAALINNGITIGGAGVPNVPSIASTVRANASAGFSIVSYEGTFAAGTIGHGLNAAPELILVKNRDTSNDWNVYHVGTDASSPGQYHLRLNSNVSRQTGSGKWNNTSPTSSVFSVADSNTTNGSGDDFIAYCFAPVEGYSAFGSYTGNNSADGPFVYTGFRPKWLLIKNATNNGNWALFDATRSTYNATGHLLLPNEPDSEYTQSPYNDFLSNGFKVRTTDSGKSGLNANQSNDTYVWAAFAEHPFKTARAR